MKFTWNPKRLEKLVNLLSKTSNKICFFAYDMIVIPINTGVLFLVFEILLFGMIAALAMSFSSA